jgi:hypothetical protein
MECINREQHGSGYDPCSRTNLHVTSQADEMKIETVTFTVMMRSPRESKSIPEEPESPASVCKNVDTV